VSECLAVRDVVTVRLMKDTREKLVYQMTVVADDGEHLVVEGPFVGSAARDLGYVVFELDDWFIEHYWRGRWYSVKQVRDARGETKGWYCDIARPAAVAGGVITSVDLDLDLWVPANGSGAVVLDEDEFEASGIERSDPAAAGQAKEALASLITAAPDRLAGVLDP
jgi:predicted RNA-binding protein associated with RNAse of E/G family